MMQKYWKNIIVKDCCKLFGTASYQSYDGDDVTTVKSGACDSTFMDKDV